MDSLNSVETRRDGKGELEKLELQLDIVCKALDALPGWFSVGSGKDLSYTLNYRGKTLNVERVYKKGEPRDGFGELIIGFDGKVKDFTFSFFTGQNEIDLEKARTYFQNCLDMLKPEFIEKIASDYNEKAGEFKSLMEQKKALNKQIFRIRREARA
jgi:hypothetical protein